VRFQDAWNDSIGGCAHNRGLLGARPDRIAEPGVVAAINGSSSFIGGLLNGPRNLSAG
jgi:hypothetical protein